jgi:prophage antirepressor-like protein
VEHKLWKGDIPLQTRFQPWLAISVTPRIRKHSLQKLTFIFLA